MYHPDWSEIVEHLYQGGVPAPDDDLSQFDLVVNAAHQEWTGKNYEDRLPPHVGLIKVGLHDSDPDEHGGTAWNRIDHTAQRVAEFVGIGRNVLVHCIQGWNRSGVIVARALMYRGWTPEMAIMHVKAHRHPMALSNPHFTRWLLRQGPSLQQDLAKQEEQ